MADVAKSSAPSTTQGVGGNGIKKKRNRKRGGGGGVNRTQSGNNGDGVKNARGGGGGSTTATSSAAGRGGGNKGGGRRRGGGGGGRGPDSGGGNLSSRYKPSAISPLQLPHVKVTLRNIGDATKHSTIEGILNSVRKFLEGAFPSSCTAAGDGTVESDAYTMAWKLEREKFDAAKSMFAEAAVANNTSSDVGTGVAPSSLSTSTSRAFSHRWVYEEKPTELPSDRTSLLPSSSDIVTNFMSNNTEKKLPDSSNITSIVDSVMSQMMQQCGKQYLHYVGGRVILDEESAVEVSLAEMVIRERKVLADDTNATVNERKSDNATGITGTIDKPAAGAVDDTTAKLDETSSVAAATRGLEKLSVHNKPNVAELQQSLCNYSPAVRVRILSVSPVKKSKRRGEIGGKVELALYPPDPCLLFKEACREVGKMVVEKYLERTISVNESTGEEKEKAIMVADGSNCSKPSSAAKKVEPQIPYYPLLSPSERSRAVARSRVLVDRTIEAMKLHAAQVKKNTSNFCWEVLESPSQKTWKGRPCSMVRSLMDGETLGNLVAEYYGAKSAGGTDVGGGEDSRADRYDSTIENSDDYKAFIESLQNGHAPPIERGAEPKQVMENKSVSVSKEPPPVDEEGRPLSAIVIHLRAKQAEVDKAKADADAARAKARAARDAAAEKTRKDKLKSKKDSVRKRKKEEVSRTKKPSSTAPSIRGSSVGGGNGGSGRGSKSIGGSSMPPPGAMLLKKVSSNGGPRPG
ncbi:hypothetical protein ACHAXA_009305 [Cyclostephanos tholiformis]|uniref:Uncharacterized protein n=1 Tax=Cyclostephanos tholiformis TaxID=382380 RepID=A0ABD3R4M4_9STRA